MRTFSIMCDFGGQMSPFDIFIGQPEPNHHPLHFQADWLLKQRGGTILPEVMDAIAKLNDLAIENNVPLEDLCVYALGSAQEENDSAVEVSQETLSEEEATGEIVEQPEELEETDSEQDAPDTEEYIENSEEEYATGTENDDEPQNENK